MYRNLCTLLYWRHVEILCPNNCHTFHLNRICYVNWSWVGSLQDTHTNDSLIGSEPKMVIWYLESVLCNFSVPWHRCCIACTAPVRFATALVWISLLCQCLTVPVLPYYNRNDTAGAPSPCNRTVLHNHFRACIFWGSCNICATPVETHLPALHVRFL